VYFVNAARNGEIEMLRLLLRAPRRIPTQAVTEALLPATINGSLRAVSLLVRAGASGDHNRAAALMCAVETCRIDLATAIIMGQNPPSAASLDKAIEAVFSATTANLQERHLLTEVLLCGGPYGNAANEGLFKATMLANMEMMQLLLEYRVDVNYSNAYAVGHAIQRNRVDLVRLLLQEQSLRPELASEAVGRISRTASPADKVAILSMLLLHGASGTQSSELLIAAAETDDLETANLLVSFGKDQNIPPVASVDYNAARCLQIAVSRNNHLMVNLLALEGRPSKFSLSKVFPLIPKVNEERHFSIVRSLLNAGAEGPEVDAALCSAVTGQQRSRRLIELFVQKGANVNGQPLLMAVSQGSADILSILLTGNPSVGTCCAAITVAMKQHDKSTRFQLVRLLLPHATAAGAEGTAVAQAVIHIFQNSPEDLELLRLLCSEGKANINFQDGQAVVLATKHKNPIFLDVVLQSRGGLPSPTAVARSLSSAMELPLTDGHRCRKVEALLHRTKPQEAMNQALIQEIRTMLAVKGDLSVLRTLLAAGADVNVADAAPLCFAVKDSTIVDLLLARRPTAQSLSMAFPLAVTLHDPARYNLCEKLLKAGAAGAEISKALFAAAKEGPPAIPFMRLLLPQADVNYNEGQVLCLVTRRAFHEGLDLLLTQRPTMPTMATKLRAFPYAMKIKEKQARYEIVKKLLAAGVKGVTLSECLITAVNDQDKLLSEVLLQSGASVEHDGGKAVLSAASSGDGDMLQLLVGGSYCKRPTLSTLTTGFGGAMALMEREGDAYYLILSILLGAGLRGEAVDAALVAAVKEGDSNLKLTELIYSNGASIEWHDGEAVQIAAQSASIATLTLLLRASPSQNTLKTAYRSSLMLPKDQRYQIIEVIMKAGKSIDKHVTTALLRATQETPADRELIKLLLSFQAFDEGQCMAHAASVLDLETLTLLIESPKACMFISSAFQIAMTGDIPWKSERGLSVMELMLETGASGEAVGKALVDAVERCRNLDSSLAGKFLALLLRFNPDVNHERGIVLQRAALRGNLDLLQKCLPRATSDSKAMAFPYIFKSSSDEALVLQMVEAFTESASGEEGLETEFKHPDPTIQPVLFMALEMFPRKTQVLKALLEAGFNPEQWKMTEVDSDFGVEPLTALCWALYQPEKRISSANIELLIDSGGKALHSQSSTSMLILLANVNFMSKSRITPVMLAIKNQRSDVLQKLVPKGAKVTIQDDSGVTPLALASQVGNSTIMEYLLKYGADVDDGSLHDAARELRCDAIRVLIKHGHDPDFPSDRHGGRSALAELCFKAVDNNPNFEDLEEAVRCLIANGADIKQRGLNGKTLFHYTLDSSDPMTILKALLKVLWKVVNEDCYLYTDGQYTYSLTKYVEKGLSIGPAVQNQEVIQLLKTKLAQDRIWANSMDAAQPEDYCGAPQHIQDEVIRRQALERRKSEMRDIAKFQVELKRYEAIEENKILQIKTDEENRRELEKARTVERIYENRADLQLRLESKAELERQRLARVRQSTEISHLEKVRDVQVSTQRAIGEAKIETEQTEHMLQIEYLETRIAKQNEGGRQQLAIEESGMQDKDRILQRQHEREMSRMKTQKTLVEKTQALANNLRTAGVNQRQIGYIMGEEP
jgi:ankyrin repeat protein